MRRMLFGLLVALGLCTTPAAAQQLSLQMSMRALCAQGVGCSQLQFFMAAPQPLFLTSLRLQLLGVAWVFLPNGGVGTYVASDDFGPFGGFSMIDPSGRVLTIDFTQTGFPFTLASGGGSGFVQMAAQGPSAGGQPTNLAFNFQAVDVNGNVITGTTTPEPATPLLLGSGLAGLGAAARRRRRRQES